MYMICLVLDTPERLDAVLEAWEEIGVTGATLLESTGMSRRRAQRAHISPRFGFAPPVVGGQEGNYTLFAVVASEKQVQQCFDRTETVVGDFSDPNTGILTAWPLTAVRGFTPSAKTQ